MPKKTPNNRLRSLFNSLEDHRLAPLPQDSLSVEIGALVPPDYRSFPPGWTWECDRYCFYTYCSPEVEEILGISPDSFSEQSLYGFALDPASGQILRSIIKNRLFPIETDALFNNIKTGAWLSVRMTIYAHTNDTGEITGYHGFNLLMSETIAASPPPKPVTHHPQLSTILTDEQFLIPKQSTPQISTRLLPTSQSPIGASFAQGKWQKTTNPWTETGKKLLGTSPEISTPLVETGSITIPFSLSNQGIGILEILDDANQRRWTEDEQLLIQEVTNQLALALENAQLYASVQEELAERMRAQQETIRRNKDLASLNQISQQLSRLTSNADIFALVEESIFNLIDNHNIMIATLEMPASTRGSESPNQGDSTVVIQLASREKVPEDNPDIVFVEQITRHALKVGRPVLFNQNAGQKLIELGIKPLEPSLTSLLALPLKAGERNLGAIILYEPSLLDAFSEIEVELLSTIATQTTASLENAYLFQEITNALTAIENRERYQANVAKSVATLTELGTRALPEVMAAIGIAAQNSRTYFAQLRDDESGSFWQIAAQWISPNNDRKFDTGKGQHIPVALYSYWLKELREKGFCATPFAQLPPAEQEFLSSQGIQSTLLLAVAGKSSVPSFIALDQVDGKRIWLNEEINVLQVAANAISNTFVREDLLDQLQVSLDETENLYNTSHRLALANSMEEMVNAIIEGVHSPRINRGVLVLFDTDNNNRISSMNVAATWYNGRGMTPPPIGSEFLRAVYERLIVTSSSLFIDDIFEYQLDASIRDVLAQHNIRSIAVLPLSSSKRQLGALLLEAEDKHRFGGREIRSYPPLVDQMAIAVENLGLLAQTEKALAETGLLYQISDGIAQASDAQDLVTLIAKNVLPKNAERASIIYVSLNADNEPSEIEVIGFYDRTGAYQRMGVRLPAAAMPILRTLGSEVLVYNDIMRSAIDPVSKKTLAQFNMLSGCLVPLRSAGRLIGLITTSASKQSDYGPEEARLLQITGSSIAVALERQRLLREAQRRALELQTAAEIARDTTSILSREILLNRIVNLIYGRFGFYHVAIFLLNEDGKYMVVQEASGEAGEKIKERKFKVLVGSRSIIGTAASNGEPVIVNDITQSLLYLPESQLPDTKSEMGIPLKLGERVIGVMDIQSTRISAFTQDDLAVMQILSDQIAVALENARSYELAQKAYEEIMEVDRLKSQFIANMSHELRTPLNSIIGFSRVIMKGIDGPINETQRQDLSAIYNSGQHLLALINDILDLSKIEAGKMQLAFIELNIVDVVNSMMSTVTGLIKDKPVKLVQIIPDDLPPIVADQTRIRQVLLNFLSNAAKFTEEGTITVEATLVSHPEDNHPEIMITITDTGPGIAEEDQHKLFQPFSQVDDSTTRKAGGTGLGLSITRSLIELHKGRIGLAWTEIGKGSQFFFTLPAHLPEPIGGNQSSIENLPNANPQSTRVILCIDDDPQVIALYEKYLQPHGYQVVALTEPKRAVAKAREINPFAITLDIMMPELDGWQVLHELKNDSQTRSTPVLICSIVEDSENGVNLGAADYLVKPFLQEDLINAINRLNYNGTIKKILIVDDDEADIRLVKKILEPQASSGQFYITTAQGGYLGWEAIQEDPPDAVILDLFMPDMDGFAILEKLRADKDLSSVIILSGADLSPEQHKKLSDFGQRMLTKGFLNQNELLASLDEALSKITPRK
jgi:signal transduction histidine kinase/DNA-binding response OmpR family regulator